MKWRVGCVKRHVRRKIALAPEAPASPERRGRRDPTAHPVPPERQAHARAAEALATARLPAFVLVRDPATPDPSDPGRYHADRLGGLLLGLSGTFADLARLVPRPPVLGEPERRRFHERRFCTTITTGLDGRSAVYPTLGEFDTSPDHEERMSWRKAPTAPEIFGVGYAIAGVCPCDPEAILDRLVGRVLGLVQSPPSGPEALLRALDGQADPGGAGRIDAYHLWRLWREHVERLYLHAPGRDARSGWDRLGDLPGALRDRLDALPDGPTGRDWERLEELLDK